MSRIVEGSSGRLLELDESSPEPVLSRAVIVAVISAVLALAASFGLDLSQAQQSALTGAAVVVVPLVAAWWARRRAWSGRTVAEVLDRQLDQVTQP